MINNNSGLMASSKDQHGFTVVELMVAMMILLIVLTIAFTFFGYGVNAFDLGEKRTLVQSNVRIASAFISNDLRYAENVVVHSSIPEHKAGVRTIYLNNSGSIIVRDEAGMEVAISGSYSDEVTFTNLIFDINTDTYKTLHYSITAFREGEQSYTLETEVGPLNQIGRISYDLLEESGVAISYMLIPDEEEAILNAYPRQIFEQTGEVDLSLMLIGDSFEVGLNSDDVSLSGAFDGFVYVSSISFVDEKVSEIRLSGSFVEGKGYITIDGNALQKSNALTVEIDVTQDYVFLSDDNIPDGMVGVAYDFTLTAVGGVPPYTFEFIDTDVFSPPGWLNLSYNNGLLSGIPNIVGEFMTVKIQVNDSSGQEDSQEYTISVDPKIFNLSMFSSGDGTTDPPTGNNLYEPDAVVTISAEANYGSVFVSWDGEVADKSANPTTVVMDEDKLVVANFTSNFIRVSSVGSGSYIADTEGNLYIKLNGSNDRVLSYYANNPAGLYSSFNPSLMPERNEILNWTNQTRQEPNQKVYWTRTQDGNNKNVYFVVSSSGIIEKYNVNNSVAYLRVVVVLADAFVEERSGTLNDPHLLIAP